MHLLYLNFASFFPNVLFLFQSPIQETTLRLSSYCLGLLQSTKAPQSFLVYHDIGYRTRWLSIYAFIDWFIHLTHQLTHVVSDPTPGTGGSEMNQERSLTSRSSQTRRLAEADHEIRVIKATAQEGTESPGITSSSSGSKVQMPVWEDRSFSWMPLSFVFLKIP